MNNSIFICLVHSDINVKYGLGLERFWSKMFRFNVFVSFLVC